MNEIELVQSLIDEVNKLPHRDEEKLDALRRRAEMIIGKVFGESSKYLKDLNSIHFFPMVYPADEHYYNEMWLSGISILPFYNNNIPKWNSIPNQPAI